MEPVHVKEALSRLDRVHLCTIQDKGDGSLQHVIEGIINMVEGITISLQKQTSILIFFIVKCFFITCLCCAGAQELKVFLF